MKILIPIFVALACACASSKPKPTSCEKLTWDAATWQELQDCKESKEGSK